MEDNKVFKKIYSLAKEICDKETTFTRTDVAFELKEFGISNDSIEVSKLIYDAYTHYGNNEFIKKAFLNNDLTRYIVEEYQVVHSFNDGNEEDALILMQTSIDNIENHVKSMRIFFDIPNEARLNLKMAEKISLAITGNTGVKDVKENAKIIYDRYSKAINYYKNAEDSIKSLTVDFIFLREHLLDLFHQYSFALIDIFGDSIKVIDPELFDFNKIEWLDTSAMKKKVNLEYNLLNKSCSKLAKEISISFNKTVDRSLKSFGSEKNYKVGLFMVALEVFGHYGRASAYKQELKEELLILKGNVKHDVTTIFGDLARLLEIYKTLNEQYIPTAELFFKNSKEVMTDDLANIIKTIYSTDELKSLKAKRDKVLRDLKLQGEKIKDRELYISYYNNNIEEMENNLTAYAPDYKEAKRHRPRKPFFLFNILSFGKMKKRYNLKISEWNQEYKGVFELCKQMEQDLILNSKQCKNQQIEVQTDKTQRDRLDINLRIVNKQIRQNIESNSQIKKVILPYLEPYIKMLYIAKNIISSSLDEKLTQKIEINKYKETDLPKEVKHQLSLFTESVKKDLYPDKEMTAKTIISLDNKPGLVSKKTFIKRDQGELKSKTEHINSLQKAAVKAGLNFLEAWSNYENRKIEDEKATDYYIKQFENIEEEFKERIALIDNKSDALREIIKQVNTSTTTEEKKNGLLLLSDASGYSIRSEDIKEMLDGTKTIIL